jgi:hypothetical protein
MNSVGSYLKYGLIGQKNGYGRLAVPARGSNRTNGCIALNDRDMEPVWMAVYPGDPIEIRPQSMNI